MRAPELSRVGNRNESGGRRLGLAAIDRLTGQREAIHERVGKPGNVEAGSRVEHDDVSVRPGGAREHGSGQTSVQLREPAS